MTSKPKAYCKVCNQTNHSSNLACKRRCRNCRGDHDTGNCPNPVLRCWCGQTEGNHNCQNKNSYPMLKLKCVICRTSGHCEKNCNATLLGLARIANTIKAVIKLPKKTPKRKFKDPEV